uniref:Odorant-binding protein 20 n=1 Tax=Chouioia cunea TaxID=1570515 RepID=A0A6B9CPT3_9HYME|nr:odorant-binding protein 20 [Chouioia cunea]
MKRAFSVLCVFLILGYAYSIDLQFVSQMKECGSEMGFSPEQVMEMMAKNDGQVGCLRACVLEKLGALQNGNLDKNVLASLLEQNKDTIPNYEQIRANLDTCYGEVTSGGLTDQCQIGGKFSTCMQEHMTGIAGLAMNGAFQLRNVAQNLNKFGL